MNPLQRFGEMAGKTPDEAANEAARHIGGDVPPGIGRHNGCNHRHSPARQICGYSDQAGFFDVVIVVAFQRAALLSALLFRAGASCRDRA